MSQGEFDPKTAFSTHQGTFPDLRELLRALGHIRWDNLHLLPVSYEVGDLMELGRRLGYLMENEDGTFTIKVDA